MLGLPARLNQSAAGSQQATEIGPDNHAGDVEPGLGNQTVRTLGHSGDVAIRRALP
jgi:hypothetical protein